MDVYELLNYKILDTSSEIMSSYNWIYKPFNIIESIIWFIYIPKTILKYGNRNNRYLIALQCFNFLLFGISDIIELFATTVLLVLFKMAILLSLIGTHKAIMNGKYNNSVA